MTEIEYRNRYVRASTFAANAIHESWNAVFRRRLMEQGLTLTATRPDEPNFYYEAPWPTNQGDDEINPHTPETDPAAWPVPSWIVPIED